MLLQAGRLLDEGVVQWLPLGWDYVVPSWSWINYVPYDRDREVRFYEKWWRVRVLLCHRQRSHHDSIGTTGDPQLALAYGITPGVLASTRPRCPIVETSSRGGRATLWEQPSGPSLTLIYQLLVAILCGDSATPSLGINEMAKPECCYEN